MKKKSKITLVALLSLAIVFIVFIAVCLGGSDSNSRHIEANYYSVANQNDQATCVYDETTGIYEFTTPSDRDLNVLQLTDTHIGGGILSTGKDKKAFDAIFELIRFASPDLVIFTGDVLYPFPIQSGNINNMKTAKQFAAFMEKLEVPYTLIFGNHDVEGYTLSNREELADFFASGDLNHCLFTKNPKDCEITGYGNQIINVRNADGTLRESLFLFDSNTYTKGSLFNYDIIHDDQVNWYKESLQALSTAANGYTEGALVPSMAFIHVPLNEYQTAWDLYNSGSSEVEYRGGVQDEKILAPKTGKRFAKGKLFDEMVALGSTNAVFCGHNHKNNFAVVYKGIQLTYGRSVVYLGINGIAKTDDYRGGTLIKIGKNGNFTTTPIEFASIK